VRVIDLRRRQRHGARSSEAGWARGWCVALDRTTGELVAIEAGATVLATGGWHQAYSFNAGPDEATGDGQAMAYRAGAELVDMEMVTFAPNILLAPPRHRGSLWFYILPGTLLNRNGDAFLSWLDPRVAKLAQTTEWNKLLVSQASPKRCPRVEGAPSAESTSR